MTIISTIEYKLLKKLGEGTFSEVFKAQNLVNGNFVAIKCLKNTFNSIDQVNSLREIQALKKLKGHKNIIKLYEVIFEESTGKASLVMELFDMNLYEAIKDRKTYLKDGIIQWYTYQLLKSIEITHKNGIFHRDLKPENILLKENHLVLADLGSCKGIMAKTPFTEYVSTRWYRAPECIMTNGYYNYKMDMWGVGCVLFEMATLYPLFPGDNEIDQMKKIENILGSPPEDVINLYKKYSFDTDNEICISTNIKGKGFEKSLRHCDDLFVDLLKKLLVYNPEERLSAKQALQHSYFKDINENILAIQDQSIIKNVNESFSIIKSNDDSQGTINQRKKNKEQTYNNNNNEKIGTKLSNLNILNKGSSSSLRNNNSLNNINKVHNNSGNIEQMSLRGNNSLDDEQINSYRKENNNNNNNQLNYKVKLPKILKLKLNNIAINNNNNNLNNYKQNAGNIGNNNFDLAKNINNSIDFNTNISYIKGVSMRKQMNILKSKYVSPYSRKAIFNLPQKYGKDAKF